MFEGLVVDEAGNSLPVKYVGTEACYVMDDDGFLRHIDAEKVDRQVLSFIKEQVEQHRDLAVGGALQMLGKDDLFTKAAIESSIDAMDEKVDHHIPSEARQWLGMLGFRVVIDDQGQLVDVQIPAGGLNGNEYGEE